jgi:hypothetical protein
MSITPTGNNALAENVSAGNFSRGFFQTQFNFAFTDSTTDRLGVGSFVEDANDGSAPDTYHDVFQVEWALPNGYGSGAFDPTFDIPQSFFAAHVNTLISFFFTLNAVGPNGENEGSQLFTAAFVLNGFSPQTLQDDYLAIIRTGFSADQAAAEAHAIDAGTATETGFVDNLFPQVENTTIPAVAVEGSMYGAVGTSDEITKLVTQFLPPQVSNALQNNLNPQVYACEALGLAFAFANETGGTGFATAFGPSAQGLPATPAGDAAFAAGGSDDDLWHGRDGKHHWSNFAVRL